MVAYLVGDIGRIAFLCYINNRPYPPEVVHNDEPSFGKGPLLSVQCE